MKDLNESTFSYFQNSISSCLGKSELYDLQYEISGNKYLTDDQKDELKEISWSRLDFLDEINYYADFIDDED